MKAVVYVGFVFAAVAMAALAAICRKKEKQLPVKDSPGPLRTPRTGFEAVYYEPWQLRLN